MRYGMVIDTKDCIGCHTCAIACRHENNVPTDIWWNRVLTDGGNQMDTAGGAWPNNTMNFLTVACQHCENPACTKVCPVGATYKDSETGIVRQDYDKCIGCRMCMAACPYTGVRSFNWSDPSFYQDHENGGVDVSAHQKHTVEKCVFCAHRVREGLQPECVVVCPMRVRHFGDLDDPDSEVSKLIATREYMQLLPSEGTKPSVYYLV